MKTGRILFIVMAVLLCSTVCHAQTKDEVSLVVYGDGANKEEATKVALRSAIEQVYGTFVSASTTIVNDELTKDEIVTVSSGNIKSYEEIAYTLLPDGRSSVTLQTVVCISQLVSYAQSKGASTEFAGATFAINMKMKELNKKNEELALQHLLTQMEAMIPFSYDAKLVIEEPTYARESDFSVAYGLNYMIKDWFMKLKEQTGKSYENEIAELTNFSENINNYYCVRMNVKFKANKTAESMFLMMWNVFCCLSLSDAEAKEYDRLNIPHTTFSLEYIPGRMENDRVLHFRSPEGIKSFKDKLQRLIYENFSGFCIVDNLGNTSYFDDEAFEDDITNEKRYCNGNKRAIRGEGLFKPIACVETDDRPNYEGASWKINIAIPKDKISEYTNFNLKRRKTVLGIDTYPTPEIGDATFDEPVSGPVETMPSFPEGLNEWGAYLSKSISYPTNAAENGIQGRVIVEFTVETDGSLTNIKVVKGLEDSLDKEAIRVVKNSPKWKPAMQDGKYIRCKFTTAVPFRL